MFTKHLLPARCCARGLQVILSQLPLPFCHLQIRKTVEKASDLFKVTKLMLMCK